MQNAMRAVLVGAMSALALLVLTGGPAAAQPLAVPLQQVATWLPLPDDDAAADTGTGGEGDGSTPTAGAEPTPEAQPTPPEPQPADPAATLPAVGAPVNVIGELPSMESRSESTLIAVQPFA